MTGSLGALLAGSSSNSKKSSVCLFGLLASLPFLGLESKSSKSNYSSHFDIDLLSVVINLENIMKRSCYN